MRSARWFQLKAGRRDPQHKSVREALEKLGYLVADLGGAAGGVADLAVLKPGATGDWKWIELKAPKGTLTDAQKTLHAQWLLKGVKIHVCYTLDDVLAAVEHSEGLRK